VLGVIPSIGFRFKERVGNICQQSTSLEHWGVLVFIAVIVGIVIPASRDATLDFVQKKKNGMNSKNLHNAQIFNIVESIMQQLLDIQNRKIIVCPKNWFAGNQCDAR
jgi:hypothetical protein